MNSAIQVLIWELSETGWSVEFLPEPGTVPSLVAERYRWIPTEYQEFIMCARLACSLDEKAWLVTGADFSGRSGSAFAWNEWEQQSLGVAGHDEEWRAQITAFWDAHLPVLLSVKSGYAYFGLGRDSLAIFCGEEPEYEQTTTIAGSFAEMLRMLTVKHPSLERWI